MEPYSMRLEKAKKHENEILPNEKTCPTKSQKENEVLEEEILLTWELCPTEILLMIFQRMDTSTLLSLMFVNSRWRTVVEHVVESCKLWPELLQTLIVSNQEKIKQKSKDSLDWRQLFYNHVLWNNLNRAHIELHQVNKVKNVLSISVYRDNLIIVSSENVIYYQIDNFGIKNILDIQCIDYIENDYLIAVVQADDEYKKIELYTKSTKNSNIFFIIGNSIDSYSVEAVMFYKIENELCYTLNRRNCLSVYSVRLPGFVSYCARQYWNPTLTRALHVFNGKVILVLQNGIVLWSDKQTRRFQKVSDDLIPICKLSESDSCEMFYEYGFVFGVGSYESFQFERHVLEETILVFRCPNLSCMLQHGSIIFLGYSNGTVEAYNPRDVTKPKAILSVNIKDLKANVIDTEIISMDVCEDNELQHLFVSTPSEVFHLAITHYNNQDYMWNSPINTAV